MLEIPLSPEKEAKLRERAAAMGKDVAEYVLEVVEEELTITEPPSAEPLPSSQHPDPWLKTFREWIASHDHIKTVADDSRESIYAGRGE
jgi:hypothetical protein